VKPVNVLLIFAALACMSVTGQDYRKTAFITLNAKIEIKAPPAKVWEALLSKEGCMTAFGGTSDANLSSLAKIGDNLKTKVGEDMGTLVVTYVKPMEAIRYNWEPEKGHYACVARFTMKAGGAGTILEMSDGYSDDQTDPDKYAKQAVEEMKTHLAAFKKFVEK